MKYKGTLIVVKDCNRALKFYSDMFGFTEEKAKTVSVADNSQEEKVQTPRVVVAQPEEKVPADMIAYLTELLGKAAKVTTVVKSVTVVDTISATVTFSLLRQFR